jgi:hypothetical protein
VRDRDVFEDLSAIDRHVGLGLAVGPVLRGDDVEHLVEVALDAGDQVVDPDLDVLALLRLLLAVLVARLVRSHQTAEQVRLLDLVVGFRERLLGLGFLAGLDGDDQSVSVATNMARLILSGRTAKIPTSQAT